MNPPLTTIIEDWIGEDKGDPVVGTNQSFAIAMMRVDAHNDALADLRARVPELADKIEKLLAEKIEDAVGNAIEDYNERNY